jgi:hypothetical protein
MDSESLLNVMTGAVVVSAVALVLQACFLGVMAFAARAVRARLDELTPKAEGLMETAEKTLVDSKKQVDEVTKKATGILDSAKQQVDRSGEFIGEATERAKIQMDRVELVLDDTISRVHQTAVILNEGVLKPVRELNAVVIGLRSAVDFLIRGRRPSVDKATTDEEMFI